MKKITDEMAQSLADLVLHLTTDEKFREQWESLVPYDEDRTYLAWLETIKEDKLSKEVLYSMIALEVVKLGDMEGANWYEDLMEKAKKKVAKK